MIVVSPHPFEPDPRDRLLDSGPSALSVAELCAILLSPGSARSAPLDAARRLLAEFPTSAALSRAAPRALARLPGVGLISACRLAAALELGARAASDDLPDRVAVSAEGLFKRYRRLALEEVESVVAVALDGRHRALRHFQVGRGGVRSCSITPREVYLPVLREGAAGLVLLHTHPSGDPTPSPEDIAFTRRVARSGETLGIPLHDHVIVASGGYESLRAHGVLAA